MEWLRPITTPRPGSAAHPWPRPLPAAWLGQLGSTTALDYVQVEPDQVAEIEVDTAYEPHRWRHPPVFVRFRADMSRFDVPLLTEAP